MASKRQVVGSYATIAINTIVLGAVGCILGAFADASAADRRTLWGIALFFVLPLCTYSLTIAFHRLAVANGWRDKTKCPFSPGLAAFITRLRLPVR